jgi:hypothetical protein
MPDLLYLIGGSKEVFENKNAKNKEFAINGIEQAFKLLTGLGVKTVFERKGTIDNEVPIHTIALR